VKRWLLVFGLLTGISSIVTFIWGLSSSWTDLEAKVKSKASSQEVEKIHNKLDIIICYLDKSKCL